MSRNVSLHIVMIGSKGLPALFGGIERHVEEVGRRLAARGHRVTVVGRKPFSRNGEHLGMASRALPAIPTKHLETASNALAATLYAVSRHFDIIHYHGIGPSIFSWIPRCFGKTAVATIHAPDYRQRKWGPAARALLRQGEQTAVRCCRASIAVSRLMTDELEKRYHRSIRYIPNGATLQEPPPFEEARRLGLVPSGYLLTVGRFIVERGLDTLIRAFRTINTEQKLVIVGDARFEERFAAELRRMADERVLFPGYITGRLLEELYAHCFCYVLPSLVEGLPISLIEAMSYARPVLVSDIPENLEVSNGIAVTFRAGDMRSLAVGIEQMLEMDPGERERRGREARNRVRKRYTWDKVADTLESLYLELQA